MKCGTRRVSIDPAELFLVRTHLPQPLSFTKNSRAFFHTDWNCNDTTQETQEL